MFKVMGMAYGGRVALVTGAGRGIGAAVARALSKSGCRVALVSRSRPALEGVVEGLRSAGGVAEVWTGDVADETSVREVARQVRERWGSIGILVNNAGSASSAPLEKTPLEEWNRLMAVNVTGTFLWTREVLAGMLSAGWGRVINIASVAGLSGAAYIAAYAASKHAVIGLTRSVAAEVSGKGVTVNAICPGYVDTDMTKDSIERIVAKTGRSREEALQGISKTNPQGRLIRPEEVAVGVLKLCDDAAAGFNGESFVMEGEAWVPWRSK